MTTAILLIGATGYVGGTILSALLNSTSPTLKTLTIHLLVRLESHAQKLRATYGDRVHPILWSGLDDTTFIASTASQYDIIINAGTGFIPAGAKAFVDGLSRRVNSNAKIPTPWYIHTSGCTNFVDKTKAPREWNDESDGQSIFEYLKALDEKEAYSQRTTELVVLETAESSGVQAVSLNVGCIFGEGRGLFNQQGLVIPLVLRYVVQHGYGFKLNERANFDWVSKIGSDVGERVF
jgi:nucleoside-diphosphate-sugar epimerase